MNELKVKVQQTPGTVTWNYAWYFGCTEEEAKEYIPEENTYPPEE